jgi:hypothetical protein
LYSAALSVASSLWQQQIPGVGVCNIDEEDENDGGTLDQFDE